jgi:hypothetical protein
MVWADGAFQEGERLPAERDGLVEPPIGPSRDGQIVDANGFVQGVEISPLSDRLRGRLRGCGRIVWQLWYRSRVWQHGYIPEG